MSNTGNPKPADLPPAPMSRWRGSAVLVFMVAGLALAVFVGTQVIGVLYAIVAPPDPPLPTGLTLIRHDPDPSHGVDEWLYGTDQDPCAVLASYQHSASDCRIAPALCQGSVIREDSAVSMGENVGQCEGEFAFSVFVQRWRVNIATGYPDDATPTRFRLSREILWTGAP